MAARESFMIVKRVLARGVSNSGGKVKAAMAVGAFSVAVGTPSDRTIASSKFSGFGGSVVVWLAQPTWSMRLLARDLPLEEKVKFGSGIGDG